jgi:translation initiation factor 1 (eIF-1/SUI1)
LYGIETIRKLNERTTTNSSSITTEGRGKGKETTVIIGIDNKSDLQNARQELENANCQGASGTSCHSSRSR